MQEALTYGALLTVKIENMQEQHRLAAESNGLAAAEAKRLADLEPAEPTEEIGFVAVCAGDGLKTLFHPDLGCSQVVRGGQTMNPSTNEILAAVRATPAKTVLVLPNNKNVIMAADQVVPLVEDRKVIILPTRTIPQGLSAMLSYDPRTIPIGQCPLDDGKRLPCKYWLSHLCRTGFRIWWPQNERRGYFRTGKRQTGTD